MTQTPSRRSFLAGLGFSGTVLAGSGLPALHSQSSNGFHLASNEYSWITFFARDGRDFKAELGKGLQEVSRSGLQGYEPSIEEPAHVRSLKDLLDAAQLEMRSIYVNSSLHQEDEGKRSLDLVLSIAGEAVKAGVRIVNTNPSPIRWGSQVDKNDQELKIQASNLQRLGESLSAMGLVLAYHNHDPEFRKGAREFHHMMVGTDPEVVRLCLDSHWIYRGTGDSQVALFDIVELYGKRIAELHIRQSDQGIWSESFGPGDIDYPALAERLAELGVRPHLVLEQAPEKGTPRTIDALETHRRSVAYARSVFWRIAG